MITPGNDPSVTKHTAQMRTAIIEIQYLPPIAYFSALSFFDEVVIEKHEHYEKQTYRNRCYINTARGRDVLIVPVTSKHGKAGTGEVRIDYSQKWLNNHWRTIQAAYGKAPFYAYFAHELHDELFKKHDLLFDLNLALLTMCLRWLRSKTLLKESVRYEKTPADGVIDLRSRINPKKPEMVQTFYQPAVYHQVFGNKFVNNLSLVDLIFCEGPGAAVVVQASAHK